jgi:hypothetical protein
MLIAICPCSVCENKTADKEKNNNSYTKVFTITVHNTSFFVLLATMLSVESSLVLSPPPEIKQPNIPKY